VADLVLKGRCVLVPAGEAARCVVMREGRIVAIEPFERVPAGVRTVELAEDIVLLPGLVDTHVHVNDQGRSEWEGFETATRAAAAGGSRRPSTCR
jgi:allantoinase